MNRLENLRGRITGPKARVAALGIAVATVGAACTPEQIATIQKAFPCPPRDVASIGETGTGTEPVSGEREDSQTAVAQNRLLTIELPAFLTNREEIVICIPTAPTGEQAIARPTPTPEVDVTNYSVKAFLKLEDKKIDKKGVIKIITANAPMIVEDLNTNGYPNLTSEKYLKQVENFLDPYFKGVQMDKSGLSAIVARIVASIENAQKAAATGDFKKADAYINVAEAYVKAGKTTFDFRKSPKELDAEIARQAKYYNIK